MILQSHWSYNMWVHFVTAGIWATDLSTCLWRMVLMNGSVHQTATSALTTAASDPTSLSTTTLRCLAGSITQQHSDIHNSRQKQRLEIYKNPLSPVTQWKSLAGCSSGWVECLPSSSFSVPAVLVYSIFRPFVFPKTAICVFRVIGTGSRACFSLSRGFNQRCIPGPWTDIHTYTHIHTETHTPSRDGRLRWLCAWTPGGSEA